MQEETPLRLGILGAARIALGGIIPAAHRSSGVEVTAVASRDGEKRGEIADAAPGARVLEGYEALLESEEVEAVYIPLPNSLHAEWTMNVLPTRMMHFASPQFVDTQSRTNCAWTSTTGFCSRSSTTSQLS